MSVVLGDAFVRVTPDAGGFGSRLSSQVNGAVGKTGSNTGKLFGATFKAASVAALGGAVLVAGALKSTVAAASEAQQSIGGTQAVFGKYSSAVITQSKKASGAFGLSATDYRENSNIIGSLLKNQGVSLDQLGGKTKDMIGISSDLAATFGGTTKDAVGALAAAYKGEFDPLQNYGITLKQSTINTEAMRVANVKSAAAFGKLSTAQQQSATRQATTNLITKQSTAAAGQFGKQTNTLAEQQQILGARVDNLKAALGTALLPIVTTVVGKLSSLTNVLLANVGPAFKTIQGVVSTVFATVTSGGGGISKFGAQFAAVGSSILPSLKTLGTQIGLTFTAVGGYIQALLPTIISVGSKILATVGPAFNQIAGLISGQLLPAFRAMLPVILPVAKFLLQAFGSQIVGLIHGFTGVITGAINIISGLFKLVVALVHGDWSAAWAAVKQILSGALTAVIGLIKVAFFSGIPGLIRTGVVMLLGFLAPLPGKMLSIFKGAFSRAVSATKSGVGNVVGFVKSLPGKIGSALASLAGKLGGLAVKGFQAFIAREKAGIGVIVGAAGTLIGKIIGAISGLAGRLGAAATTAFQSFIGREKAGIGNILSIAKSIPGRIKGALGSLGGLLVAAGGELVNGLIRGISAKIGALVAKMRQLAQTIKDHLPGSPVKTGPLTSWNGGAAGKRLVGLLADGLGQTAPVDAAMKRMSERVAGGLSGALSGLAKGLDGGLEEVTATLDKLSTKITSFYDKKIKNDKKSAAASKAAIRGLKGQYAAIIKNAKAHDLAKANLDAGVQIGTDITASTQDSAKITSLQPDEGTTVTASSIQSYLATKLAGVKNFAAQLGALQSKGLNQAAIQDIAAAGVDAGTNYAAALASASAEQIQAINDSQAQIATASQGVGQNAVSGLVTGLTKDLADVDAAGAVIANRLRDAIRNELGLKNTGKGGDKKGPGKKGTNKAALALPAGSKTTGQSRSSGPDQGRTTVAAPLIATAYIRETVDLDKYSRQQAFRERMFNVGG